MPANQPESSSLADQPGPVSRQPASRRPGLILGAIAVGISLVALAVSVTSFTRDSPLLSGGEGLTDSESHEESPGSVDPLFVQPNDVANLFRMVKDSVLLIQCGDGAGTGWIINTAATPEIRSGRDREFDAGGSALAITADHVIADCRNDESTLEAFLGERPIGVRILNWHKRADVALLAINASDVGLETTTLAPPLSWAMSVGYPWDFDFPVPLVGQVVDRFGPNQYVDMAIQPGNSGSPIVNSHGQIIGTAVASLEDAEMDLTVGWTVAVPTETLCERLFNCEASSITSMQQSASLPQ